MKNKIDADTLKNMIHSHKITEFDNYEIIDEYKDSYLNDNSLQTITFTNSHFKKK